MRSATLPYPYRGSHCTLQIPSLFAFWVPLSYFHLPIASLVCLSGFKSFTLPIMRTYVCFCKANRHKSVKKSGNFSRNFSPLITPGELFANILGRKGR